MSRARLLSSGRSAARLRDPAPPRAATNAEAFARLSRAAGNRAVARILARRPYDAPPPIKDRTRIDQLAKTKGQSAADRCRAYAEIAGTQSVQMDPTAVHTSAFYSDGVNLDALKQARDVPATTYWLDDSNRPSGGGPPEKVKGVAIVVNSNSNRFEDADYMVAAIRHEMVHVRLMRLTLKHLTDWKKAQNGLSFTQYVDKHVAGTDAALVKDRYFGGHMDEVVAYLEGFLTAYAYSAIETPDANNDRAWIRHLKGFTKEFETARANSGALPKNRKGIPEASIATKQSANAVVSESERVLKDYCDAAGETRRQDLAAWAQRLYKTKDFYDAALKLIYKVATKGKTMPEPKR
jgi:hypothetical protein